MNTGTDHQASAVGSEAVREYRVRAKYWVIAIGSGLFFAAFGMFSTYSAWFNIDGSFPHPFEMAMVFTAFWTLMFLLAIWLLCSCWRERLRISAESIIHQRCLGSTEIPTPLVERINWRPYPVGGRIEVHSGNRRIKFEVGQFPPAAQRELISYFREQFPLSIQSGWREFEICVLGVTYYPPED